MPKVSVIIPVYNGEKYLKYCIDSVVKQTLQDIQIILVNDGSTDNSLEIIDDYAQYDSRIVVINQINSGVSTARNHGLLEAKSKYVFFMDDDDSLEYTALEEMYRIAEEKQLDIITTDVVFEYNGKEIIKEQPIRKNEVLKISEDKLIIENYLKTMSKSSNCQGAIWNSLYRSDFIRGLLFFLPREIVSAEDYLFKIYAILLSKRIMFLDKTFYHYRVLEDSQSRSQKKPFLLVHILPEAFYIRATMDKFGFDGKGWFDDNFIDLLIYVLIATSGYSFGDALNIIRSVLCFPDINEQITVKHNYNIKRKIILYIAKYKCAMILTLLIRCFRKRELK